MRPTGGRVAATSRPRYRRVRRAMVDDAKPPSPSVFNHSRRDATSRLRHTDRSNRLMSLPAFLFDHEPPCSATQSLPGM